MNILLAILYGWWCGLQVCTRWLCAGVVCVGVVCAGLERSHLSVSSLATALSLTGPSWDSVCLGTMSGADGIGESARKTPASYSRELQRNVPSTAGPGRAVRATRTLWLVV